ncbi:mycofactocin system transcriptional regulator [Tsukamurella paurometabola]|uniref:Mycofactocin system transcriptional regulator n=1 Tax=Tsukamurella paurometabola TaxID=2061 RepID=A0A3P8K2M5_TSUPA|nr:mycofactocin system transcriptional regulator [Tsukamurella paurometabola]
MPQQLGLRERKKLKTRLTLRRVAYDLFREQGFEATTVAQIAAAAEVSPATFFRYFATKEALILEDDYDAILLANVPPIDPTENLPAQILRGGADQFEALDPETRATEVERGRLLYSSPALRAAQARDLEATMAAMEDAIIERATGPIDRLSVRAAVGAVVGAITALARDDPSTVAVMPESMRAVADLFEAGLPVSPTAEAGRWGALRDGLAGTAGDPPSPGAG